MPAPIVLSASQIHAHDDCRRLHWYRSVARVRTVFKAAALSFGTCVDTTLRDYLMAVSQNAVPPDPVDAFTRRWKHACESAPMTFSATQSPEALEQMGRLMMEAFPDRWDETRWTVAKDAAGAPMLDRRFRVQLGPALYLTGLLDLAIYTQDGAFALVDIKTGASAHTERFAKLSDQLTSYDLLLHAHGRDLGLPELERLGFLTLLKRKKTVRIETALVAARTRDELEEFIRKCGYIADDLRRGRYDRCSRLAHNSPCGLCDYAAHCIDGDSDGLLFPEDAESEHTAIAA